VDNVVETPNSTRTEQDEDEELFDEGTPFDLDTDETPHGLDDEEATDLDIGSDLQQTTDNIADGDQGLEWDMDGILPPAPIDSAGNDDASGPEGFDPTIGVSEVAPENLDDASLGFEGTETFVVPDMPDWRGDDKEQALFDDREFELPDESQIQDAASPWSACFEQAGSFDTLCSTDQRLFAGGHQLLVFDDREFLAVPCPSSLVALSRLGRAPSALLAATKSGVLLRFPAPYYAHPTTVNAGSTAHDAAADGGHAPQLVAWSDHECAVLTGAGRLLTLTEAEAEPKALRLRHPVVKLPLATDHPLLVVQGEHGLCLSEAEGSGASTWRTLPIEARVARSLASDSFEVLALGPYVVFAGARVGVVVIDTRVQSYQRVPGCVGVAAVASGLDAGEPRFWVALSQEFAGRTDLVQIDPLTATALRVAVFETVADDEFAPARALTWNPARQVLYAAGDFGVKGFRATP
jgi:hypothetical protein